jgi:hypothetical protein
VNYKELLKSTLEELQDRLSETPALKYKVQVALDYLFYLEDRSASNEERND